ncbi:MAG: hypothetical protein ACU0BC_09905 [Pseudooceanicola nanhaiensis]|uniref:Anti-sigma-K factor RskA n=1 Tax=Marinibacterium profundimaris TaxID=1679460 RepID=A0A225NL16_9RHOB|nr:hypothetical protein [Marinibacterium profundimaris]OWU74878.1 hypothetical protein ATO3_09910 [Marinibacterium profundimaris]
MSAADDILSAELALGLLDGPEAARAEARVKEDPDFARRVAQWGDDLAATIGGPADLRAPAHVLDRVRDRLFGKLAPVRDPVTAWGLPWGRIIGAIVAAKVILAAAILAWNQYWISRAEIPTAWGPAKVAWHQRQGRIRLEHPGPPDLLVWVEEAGALRYLGTEGDWIAAGLQRGAVLLLGPGRPARPEGEPVRLILYPDM